MRFRFSLNPVLVKEMRGRMRGPRAYFLLTATLALLALVGYGLYRLVVAILESAPGGGPPGAAIGQVVFVGLIFLTTLVVCTISPSLTAGAISGEYERKTFDLLVSTPQSPVAIILGKWIAALSYVLLVLLAAFPLVSLAFVFGGVALTDIGLAFLMLLGFALTYTMLGLCFSALFRRTGLAVTAGYLVLIFSVFGTFFAYIVAGVVMREQPPSWILALNPFSAMASALTSAATPGTLGTASTPLQILWVLGGGRVDMQPAAAPPLWQLTGVIYGCLTIQALILASELIKPVGRFRPRLRIGSIIGVLALAPVLAPLVIYGPLTPERVVAWARWTQAPPQNLVTNGKFTTPLEPDWQTTVFLPGVDPVKVSSESGQTMVRFSRSGDSPSQATITQPIGKTVSKDGWLQVRAVLRVSSQDIAECGKLGVACPLTIKLNYEDDQGVKRDWSESFYAVRSETPVCDSCDTVLAAILIPQSKWYTYQSPNLLLALNQPERGRVSPRAIHSLSITAAGNSYQAEVAEIALFASEGRPLTWGNESIGTPAPIFIRRGIAVPVPVAPPPPVRAIEVPVAPTATEMPTGTPSAGATPTPVSR